MGKGPRAQRGERGKDKRQKGNGNCNPPSTHNKKDSPHTESSRDEPREKEGQPQKHIRMEQLERERERRENRDGRRRRRSKAPLSVHTRAMRGDRQTCRKYSTDEKGTGGRKGKREWNKVRRGQTVETKTKRFARRRRNEKEGKRK
jgi:hypothetical protein